MNVKRKGAMQCPRLALILGVSKLEHLEQNVQAAEGALDAETLAACDEVWGTLRGDHFRYNR